jgi:hypothetical protein
MFELYLLLGLMPLPDESRSVARPLEGDLASHVARKARRRTHAALRSIFTRRVGSALARSLPCEHATFRGKI